MCNHGTDPCRYLHSQATSQDLFSWQKDSPGDPSPRCPPALGCAHPGGGLRFGGPFENATSKGLQLATSGHAGTGQDQSPGPGCPAHGRVLEAGPLTQPW